MSAARAWVHLLGSLGALSGLSTLLPGPGTVLVAFSGQAGTAYAVDPTSTVETAALLAVAVVVWVLLVWAALIVVAAGLGRLPGALGRRGRRVLVRIAPGLARQLVLTAVGASLITGVGMGGSAAVAGAATPPPATPPAATHLGAVGPAAGRAAVEGSTVRPGPGPSSPVTPSAPDIDWPATTAPTTAQPAKTAPAPRAPRAPVDIDWPGSSAPVVVVRGDTLWSIAARRLPAAASDADVDRAWRQWYAANAAVIGADPNVILPGQILQPPTRETGQSS